MAFLIKEGTQQKQFGEIHWQFVDMHFLNPIS